MSPAVGEEYISEISNGIYNKIEAINLNETDNPIKHLIKINDIYDIDYSDKRAELGHYFRHLYHIFKYTHESNLPNKKKYIDLIQAQMSDDELYVTFYNSLSKYGIEKFAPLLDVYQFFENIGERGPIFSMHARTFYPKTRFKFLSERN